MNPFTESTVAQPLTEPADAPSSDEPQWPDPASGPIADSSTVAPKPGNIFARFRVPARQVRKRTGPLSRRTFLGSGGLVVIALKKSRRPFFGVTLGAASLAAGLSAVLPSIALAVDVNAASQAQLEAVRGIGPKTAQIIIQERTRGGQYESFEDLSERVKGIGPKKAASLQASGLTLSQRAAGTSVRPAAVPDVPRTVKR